MAREPSDNSQSGRSRPSRSAAAASRSAAEGVDARRSREQRALAVAALGVGVPFDLAGRVLVVEREVDRPLDHGEELVEESGVAGREVVVPHAVGHITGDVGVERVLLHRVTLVVGVPRAGECCIRHSQSGALGLGESAADVECHRGFDEVPRVGLAAGYPRNVAVGLLHRRDRVDRLRDLRAGQDAGDLTGSFSSPKAALPHFAPSWHLLAVDDEALAEHRVQRAR